MNEEEINKLVDPMLKMRLYVVTNRVIKPELMGEFLAQHLQFQIDTEKKGMLLAAGPFVDEVTGAPDTGGMTIIRCNSLEEAKEHANNDPFVINGVVEIDVLPWQLNEGRLKITVDFSDQTYNFS